MTLASNVVAREKDYVAVVVAFDLELFDGKPGEDPNNHVMTYHLWCSSNSLIDDSIHM